MKWLIQENKYLKQTDSIPFGAYSQLIHKLNVIKGWESQIKVSCQQKQRVDNNKVDQQNQLKNYKFEQTNENIILWNKLV